MGLKTDFGLNHVVKKELWCHSLTYDIIDILDRYSKPRCEIQIRYLFFTFKAKQCWPEIIESDILLNCQRIQTWKALKCHLHNTPIIMYIHET